MARVDTTPGYTWVNDELVTYDKLRAAARPTVDSDRFNVETPLDPQRNLLHNPDFDNWQLGTSITAATKFDNDDDEYTADRWVLLSDGDDIVDVSQETATVPSGSTRALKATVQTINKKFGFMQILENRDTVRLRGQSISASLQARIGADDDINNLRITILQWTGTADVVTSDVVSAWNGAGNEPTYATNWASLKASGNRELSDSAYGVHKAENATVGASATNLAMFIYIDDTDAVVGDALYLGQMQLEVGAQMTAFAHLGSARDWTNCLRFLEYLRGVRIYNRYRTRPGSGKRLEVPVSFFSKRITMPSLSLKVYSSRSSDYIGAYLHSRTMLVLQISADPEDTYSDGTVDIWVRAEL